MRSEGADIVEERKERIIGFLKTDGLIVLAEREIGNPEGCNFKAEIRSILVFILLLSTASARCPSSNPREYYSTTETGTRTGGSFNLHTYVYTLVGADRKSGITVEVFFLALTSGLPKYLLKKLLSLLIFIFLEATFDIKEKIYRIETPIQLTIPKLVIDSKAK